MKIRSAHIEQLLLLTVVVACVVVSAISPFDQIVWFLEAVPVLIAIPLLLVTWSRYPLTTLLYRLIFIHALILLWGAHYSYAQVPLGFWLQDWFDFSRNHYDRIGHFMQGFMPAILAREILLRSAVIRTGGWLFFIVTSICLAFSAFYELLEWWVALLGEQAADAFLGSQGDVCDTQWDMFLALSGAILAQVLLRSLHDFQIRQIAKSAQ